MGKPKRRKGRWGYYANTEVDGIRLRMSLNTDNWQTALARQKEEVDKVRSGKTKPTTVANREWMKYRLEQALDVLYDEHVQNGKAEGGLLIMKERSKPLKRLLGDKLLRKIDGDDLARYQADRRKDGISERTIGMELEVMRSVLKKVRRWERINEGIKIAKSKDEIGRALTEDERKRLFALARSRPRWYRALYAGVISVNTTGRRNEILKSRFHDVDLAAAMWYIRKGKTKGSKRDIPLNPEAKAAFDRMFNYATEELGCDPPGDYFIFCACENNAFDYTRPQKSVRSAWRSLTRAAGLRGFRIHDLRHTAITDMAEDDQPVAVMQSIAGHLSPKMIEYYTHVRTKAKEKAVAALGGTGILDTISTVAPVSQRKPKRESRHRASVVTFDQPLAFEKLQ